MNLLVFILLVIIYNILIFPAFGMTWYVYIMVNLLWIFPIILKAVKKIKVRALIPEVIENYEHDMEVQDSS